MITTKKDDTETAKMLEDLELEMSIVGYLTSAPFNHVQEVRQRIKTKHFYHEKPRELFRLICWFNDKGEEVDPTKLLPEVKRRNMMDDISFMNFLAYRNKYVTYIDLLQHLPYLVEYAQRRDVWMVAQVLTKEGTTMGDDICSAINKAKASLDNIILDSNENESISMQDVLKELQVIVEDNINGKNDGLSTNTGFHWIDERGGLRAPDLNIIAGESSTGKTSFADSIALNVIQQGKSMVFYSLEMSRQQLTARMTSHFANLYSRQILNDKLDSIQLKQFDKAVGDMWDFSQYLYFSDKAVVSIDEIATSIRKHKAKYDISGAVVDYIQLVGGQERGEKDETFLARVARTFKNLCLELNIWIIALSQLNRDKDNPLPTLNRLRGSGQITEASDNIWMLYRPDYYNKKYGSDIRYPSPFENVKTEGTAEILVAKGRNVGDGAFICGFNPNATHFYDMLEPPIRGAKTEENAKEEKLDKFASASVGVESQQDLPF